MNQESPAFNEVEAGECQFAAYGFHLIKKGWSGKQRLWQVEKIFVEKQDNKFMG